MRPPQCYHCRSRKCHKLDSFLSRPHLLHTWTQRSLAYADACRGTKACSPRIQSPDAVYSSQPGANRDYLRKSSRILKVRQAPLLIPLPDTYSVQLPISSRSRRPARITYKAAAEHVQDLRLHHDCQSGEAGRGGTSSGTHQGVGNTAYAPKTGAFGCRHEARSRQFRAYCLS
jgi:hypothetical protein